jgi:hypothetical protein
MLPYNFYFGYKLSVDQVDLFILKFEIPKDLARYKKASNKHPDEKGKRY